MLEWYTCVQASQDEEGTQQVENKTKFLPSEALRSQLRRTCTRVADELSRRDNVTGTTAQNQAEHGGNLTGAALEQGCDFNKPVVM